MDSNKELEISIADADQLEFAWPLYRDFIENVVFKNADDAPEWSEAREKSSFEAQWKEKTNYVISLDGRAIGWVAASESKNAITLENMFIQGEFQNRGIGLKLFHELSKQWRAANMKVFVPISMLSQYGERLQKLVESEGFRRASLEGGVSTMESNW